ncbi:hypothetical protein BD408DRAFT_431691 [Parasitella parasitica]|nr:hypothetical protein BD408DRAFT_431691 [Parasitella parasitica]
MAAGYMTSVNELQLTNFNNQYTSSGTNAQTADNTTMPKFLLKANPDIANAATTPIPSSQANPDVTNAATMPISSSEWRLNTKRAINKISEEIKQLKKARRNLKKP